MTTLTETAPSITPSPSIHDLSTDVWDFSVPVDLDKHTKAPRHGSAPSSLKSRNAGYPINGDVTHMHNRINGYNSRPNENVPVSRSATDSPAFLDAPKSTSVHRNDSTVSSSNHDGDSVFDLYSGNRMSTAVGTTIDTRATRNGSISGDDSKWIDRDKLARIEGEDQLAAKWIDSDKLAQIETQEMAQAGIVLGAKGNRNSFKPLQTDPKRQRLPSPPVDGPLDEDGHEFLNQDPRHPSEIALDNINNPMRQAHRNGSSSKIPLSTTSRIPVRQEILGRSAPLVRQAPSPDQGSDEDDVSGAYIHSRKRSYSASSAVVLNGDSESSTTASVARPPRSSRSQTHSTIVPPARKNSQKTKRTTTTTNLAKSRSKSNPQLNGPRPASSSHNANRETLGSAGKSHAHHVPDGPPPWSLSTYSPDPKLPPEEQIIPTVAKRLQQEQWEKEGKFASVYDGKLRPLKVEEDIDPNKSEYRPQEGEDKSAWPLAAQDVPEERGPISRIPNNAPTIAPKMPRAVSPLDGPGVRLNGIETTISGPVKTTKTPEKEKEKSKFCCCIVM